MAKVKYYYDSDTLSYRRVEKSKGNISKIIILSFFGVILIMLTGFIVYILFPPGLYYKRGTIRSDFFSQFIFAIH